MWVSIPVTFFCDLGLPSDYIIKEGKFLEFPPSTPLPSSIPAQYPICSPAHLERALVEFSVSLYFKHSPVLTWGTFSSPLSPDRTSGGLKGGIQRKMNSLWGWTWWRQKEPIRQYLKGSVKVSHNHRETSMNYWSRRNKSVTLTMCV